MLCDLLHRNRVCTAHEYFQSHQYMPALKARWGSETLEAYWRALQKRRNSADGTLGLNLHASHLNPFRKLLPSIKVPIRAFVLRRGDIIGQAVSYGIAAQTGQWSHHFDAAKTAVYKPEMFKRKLNRIQNGERANLKFCHAQGLDFQVITYEELIRYPREMTELVADRALDPFEGTALRRQAGGQTREFTVRLARDLD